VLRLEIGTDEEDTNSNEATTYTMKDGNDTRRLYHAIKLNNVNHCQMIIPSGDTVNLGAQSKHKDLQCIVQTSRVQSSVSSFTYEEEEALYRRMNLSQKCVDAYVEI